MFSKKTDDWETPREFFKELDREFRFGLDAAASEDNSKCTSFLDLGLDALRRDWATEPGWSVWLNPPYSRCAEFIAKAAEESRKGTTVVALVPARTCTRWFHAHVWDTLKHQPRDGVEVRFIKGRLKFGEGKNSAPFPSVVIVFRGRK
jgi:site-specific DNA-methyltransferase (adenine-specific)